MKQLAIVSGKGGTGKTTVAAAFAELAEQKVIADCDVEAPNLHLVLGHRVVQETEFMGNKTARIDSAKCTNCNRCLEVCRYAAVLTTTSTEIDAKLCEGCGACVYACPTKAIELYPEATGKVYLSETEVGNFAHAELYLAADGSGKLVAEVRRLARENALGKNSAVIIDGSPGIGCVVISTITGCQQVLVVTEPTKSGKHDLERVLKVTEHFKVSAQVVVNKYDVNIDISREIEDTCRQSGIEIVGRIPFDPMVPKAIASGHPITRYSCRAEKAIRKIWAKIAPGLTGT